MKSKPDAQYKYRVNTCDGVRYLNEQEKDDMMDVIFRPLPDDAEDEEPEACAAPLNT